MMEKPNLALVEQPTEEDFAEFFELIAGREATLEEIDEVRAEMAKLENDSDGG